MILRQIYWKDNSFLLFLSIHYNKATGKYQEKPVLVFLLIWFALHSTDEDFQIYKLFFPNSFFFLVINWDCQMQVHSSILSKGCLGQNLLILSGLPLFFLILVYQE